MSAGKPEASLSSSSLSVRDVLRQRYSVTWHPRLMYLIVSDGYMATVMRVLNKPSPALLLKTLLKDTTKDLEKASRTLDKSQVVNTGSTSASDLVFTLYLTILDNTVSSHSLLSDSCEGMAGVGILPEPGQQPWGVWPRCYTWAPNHGLCLFSSHRWSHSATFPAGPGDTGWYQGASGKSAGWSNCKS